MDDYLVVTSGTMFAWDLWDLLGPKAAEVAVKIAQIDFSESLQTMIWWQAFITEYNRLALDFANAF